MKTYVLTSEFSSAHFYHQPLWSQEKNQKIFGRCFTPYGHGHNYVLKSEWALVSEAELVELRKQIDALVSVIDHEHLNLAVPEFKNKIPTTEVILEYFESQINQKMSFKLVNLELFETPEIGARLL